MLIYGVDYAFGYWVCVRLCGFNMIQYNPIWMGWLNEKIALHTGIKNISLWTFLVGGNILGIIGALIMYPLMKYIFIALSDKNKEFNNSNVNP